MAKMVGKIIIFVLPIFFVVFTLAYAYNGFSGDFAPSYADAMAKVATFPDIGSQWRTFKLLGDAGVFTGPLQPLVYLGYILSVPIQVVGWFFTVIFA